MLVQLAGRRQRLSTGEPYLDRATTDRELESAARLLWRWAVFRVHSLVSNAVTQ